MDEDSAFGFILWFVAALAIVALCIAVAFLIVWLI